MGIRPVVLHFIWGAAVLAAACTAESTPSAASSPVSTIEDHSLICMVTDRYMGSPQIPTQAEGHTYYGCCAGCAAKLREQPGARLSKDPVTGRQVDKASAVVGKLADGRVLYFESKQSLERYRP